MTKAVTKRVPTPKPVVVEQICSICDEDWAEHPENATTLDCIEILKSKRNHIKVTTDSCCGHGHHCCHSHHFWHYWYTYPYNNTVTSPTWTINTPLADTNSISISNIYDEATSKSIAALVSSIRA